MATEMRAAKRRRLTGGVITITAGQGAKRETFHAHESILQERSGFFKAALSKEWKEGQEKKIEMPDDRPDAVGAYLEWLFFEKITSSSAKADGELTVDDIRSEYTFLAHLYVLGEKLLDDHFCDSVIKAMTELCNTETSTGFYCLPSRPMVKIIYPGTSANSPARKFLVDIYKAYGNRTWITSNKLGEWDDCVDFLLDIARGSLSEQPQNIIDVPVKPDWLKLKRSGQ